jgi:hypothetical protein
MMLCPKCKNINKNDAVVCSVCRMVLPQTPRNLGEPASAPLPLPRPAAEPQPTPAPSPSPIAGRVLPVPLTPEPQPAPASVQEPLGRTVESEPGSPIHFALLDQLERLLGRRPTPSEPVPQVALQLKERIDAQAQAGALPQEPDLLNRLEEHFSRPMQAGEPAAPLISALLQDASRNSAVLQPVSAPNTIPIPETMAKIMGPLPHRFKWLAALIAPLLVGGGAGAPFWWSSVSNVRAQLEQKTNDIARTQRQEKSDTEQASKNSQPKQIAPEGATGQTTKGPIAQQMLPAERETLMAKNSALQEANQKLAKDARTNDEQIKHLKTNASSAAPKSGFVAWQSTGKTKVNFGSTVDAGRITEGSFPPGRCTVELVLGEHVNPKKAPGSDCHNFAFEVKSKTTAYILWRAE